MSVTIRTANDRDDLHQCWPNLGKLRWNREQVIVAVDDDDGSRLLGGIILIHGGHEFLFVCEFAVIDRVRARLVAKRLLDAMMQWAQRHGATQLLFHAKDSRFISQAVRLGGRPLGPTNLLTMPVHDWWERDATPHEASVQVTHGT